MGGDECRGDLGQQEWKEGLRDGSETDCDAWFGDRGADEKTGGWARGGRAENIMVFNGSEQDGQD